MDELLQEFLTETGENLDTVDRELVRFEQAPNDRDILRNIFRLVHTVKGTCGFIGLPLKIRGGTASPIRAVALLDAIGSAMRARPLTRRQSMYQKRYTDRCVGTRDSGSCPTEAPVARAPAGITWGPGRGSHERLGLAIPQAD